MSFYVNPADVTVSCAAGLPSNFTFSDYLTAIGKTGGGDSVDLADLRCSYRRKPADTNYETAGYLSGSNSAVFFNGVILSHFQTVDWPIVASLNTIQTGNGPVKMLLPGTFPGFTSRITTAAGSNSDSTIAVTRTATSLKIGSSTFTLTSTNSDGELLFPDGVIPLRIICILQAAGGGGGGNQDRAGGGGGGAGGCCVFILDLLKYPYLSIYLGGSGKAGLAKLAGSEGYGDGGAANDSFVYDNMGALSLVRINGGGGGKEGNNAEASPGGAGGTVGGDTTYLNSYRVKSITGASGGKGAGNSNRGTSGGSGYLGTVQLTKPLYEGDEPD